MGSVMAGEFLVGQAGDLPGTLTHEVSDCGTVLTSIYRHDDTELVVKARWCDAPLADPRIGSTMRALECRLPLLLEDARVPLWHRICLALGSLLPDALRPAALGPTEPVIAWRLTRGERDAHAPRTRAHRSLAGRLRSKLRHR